MNIPSIKNFLIILLFINISYISIAHTHDHLPNIPGDISKLDLCPKEPDNWTSEREFEHVLILIDKTSWLEAEQIEWISDTIFSEKFVKKYRPYTRFSVLFINDKSPQLQEYIYSGCRPKMGKKSNAYDDEIHSKNEIKAVVKKWYQRFLNGDDDIDGWLKVKNKLGTTIDADSSYIFETFIRALKDPSLDFGSDEYTKRKVIIVSDLMQHSKEFSFYRICNATTNLKQMNKCPTFDSALKKNDKLQTYLNMTKPKDVVGLSVELKFLNFKHEANEEIYTSLVNLWKDYFKHIGLEMPSDNLEWTDWQLNF